MSSPPTGDSGEREPPARDLWHHHIPHLCYLHGNVEWPDDREHSTEKEGYATRCMPMFRLLLSEVVGTNSTAHAE